MGFQPFSDYLMGIIKTCRCYDAVRKSTSCIFMSKMSQIRLKVDVLDELKLVNIYHRFAMLG